jgi:hypothetical protein
VLLVRSLAFFFFFFFLWGLGMMNYVFGCDSETMLFVVVALIDLVPSSHPLAYCHGIWTGQPPSRIEDSRSDGKRSATSEEIAMRARLLLLLCSDFNHGGLMNWEMNNEKDRFVEASGGVFCSSYYWALLIDIFCSLHYWIIWFYSLTMCFAQFILDSVLILRMWHLKLTLHVACNCI